MSDCAHELHNLYPTACPGCAPEVHAEMLEQAPEGVLAPATPEGAIEAPEAAQRHAEDTYGDTY